MYQIVQNNAKISTILSLFPLYCYVCHDEEEDLCDEGHPCRSDEAIYWDEYDITDYIEDCYTSIDVHHLALFSSRNQDIGVE